MVQDGPSHATLEHCNPATQDGRSCSLAQEPNHPPAILAPPLPVSSTFSSIPNQPPDLGHTRSINHSTYTLGHTSGIPPQKSAILDEGPSSSPLDKMVVPFTSLSSNQLSPVVRDNKPCCYQ